jgi:hypothetical protein
MLREEVDSITIGSNDGDISLPIVVEQIGRGGGHFFLKAYITRTKHHYFELEDREHFRLFRTRGWKNRWNFSKNINNLGEFITSHLGKCREVGDRGPNKWKSYSIFDHDRNGYYLELITRGINQVGGPFEERVRYDFYPVTIDNNESQRMICRLCMDLNELRLHHKIVACLSTMGSVEHDKFLKEHYNKK